MKIKLNEDLFDDVVVVVPEEDSTEETPSGPPTGVETTIANELIDNVNGEWDTITKYNNMITDLKQAGLDDFIPVIEDINNEEHKHVGQLQELLKQISPNTNSIASGETEGAEQIAENLKSVGKQLKEDLTLDDYKHFISSLYDAVCEVIWRFTNGGLNNASESQVNKALDYVKNNWRSGFEKDYFKNIEDSEDELRSSLHESYIQEKDTVKQAKDIKDYIRDFVANIAIKHPKNLYKIKNRAFEFSSYLENFINNLEDE